MRLSKEEQKWVNKTYRLLDFDLKMLSEGTSSELLLDIVKNYLAPIKQNLKELVQRKEDANMKYINRELRKNFKFAESRHAGYNKRKL